MWCFPLYFLRFGFLNVSFDGKSEQKWLVLSKPECYLNVLSAPDLHSYKKSLYVAVSELFTIFPIYILVQIGTPAKSCF